MSRIQLEMPDGRVKELEELMEKQCISTKKDLLNRAITFYEWYIKEKESGHEVASIDEERSVYKIPILT